jgi:hypothetical protein
MSGESAFDVTTTGPARAHAAPGARTDRLLDDVDLREHALVADQRRAQHAQAVAQHRGHRNWLYQSRSDVPA